MWTKRRPKSLCAQSGPHEYRERQHQRPGAEVKSGARTDRRTLIHGALDLIGNRPSALSVHFAGIAYAARGAALAPSAAYSVTGIGDGDDRSRASVAVTGKS